MKDIAEEELRASFQRQFQKEADVERVLTNLSAEYVFALVKTVWDGDFEKMLRDRVRKDIESGVRFYIFRRKDAWDRSESPGVAILDDEIKKSRPLIRAAVEKHIAEYPFHELDKEEIEWTILDVIKQKILTDHKEVEKNP